MTTKKQENLIDVVTFSSQYSVSFSRSILTLDKATEIKENSPVSICSIAKKHELKQVFLIDSSFSGFQEAYRNLTEIGVQLIFGVKLHVCDDVTNKSDKGRINDSKIYLIAKNQAGYKELIKVYSKAAVDGFYYYPRLDWLEINKLTKNIDVWIPFYDGFVFCNLFNYGTSIIPRFNSVKPKFCIESHELPFDSLIEDGVKKYCEETGFETIRTHQVYYYKNSDVTPYCVYRCINNRSTLDKPNLSAFSSNKFSFESYQI